MSKKLLEGEISIDSVGLDTLKGWKPSNAKRNSKCLTSMLQGKEEDRSH